jgi:hypothetical protein
LTCRRHTVLKARIDLRVWELKVLAAWTATNWHGCAEPEAAAARSPATARDDEPDEAGHELVRAVKGLR